MPRRVCLPALLFLTLARPAVAQGVLTLPAAVEQAAARNPAVRQARAALDQADAQATEARAAWFPRVTFGEAWQRGTLPVFGFGSLLNARQFTQQDFDVDRLNSPGATNAFSARVVVGQTLFDGGRTRAMTATAGSARSLADATLNVAIADVSLAVVQTYGRVLAAVASERAAHAAVSAAEEDAARAEHRRAAGTATDADVLAIEVHLADMRRQAVTAAGEGAIARAELNRLTGAAIDRPFDVVEPDVPADTPEDLATLFAAAEAARPELRRASAAADLAAARQRESRAAWIPRLDAQASYEANGLSFGNRSGSWMVGGQFTWTLSVGGAEAARVRAASAAHTAAQAALDDARASVQVDVVSALERLKTARTRVALAERAALQAREGHRIQRNRYEAGLAQASDLLQAASAQAGADQARIAALVDVLTADAALRRAAGRPITFVSK